MGIPIQVGSIVTSLPPGADDVGTVVKHRLVQCWALELEPDALCQVIDPDTWQVAWLAAEKMREPDGYNDTGQTIRKGEFFWMRIDRPAGLPGK